MTGWCWVQSLPFPPALPILWRRDLLSGQFQLQSPSWESQAAEGSAASLCCPILIPWLLCRYYSREHIPNLTHAHLCLRVGFLEKLAHGHGIPPPSGRGAALGVDESRPGAHPIVWDTQHRHPLCGFRGSGLAGPALIALTLGIRPRGMVNA